jgi:hypothetical protein
MKIMLKTCKKVSKGIGSRGIRKNHGGGKNFFCFFKNDICIKNLKMKRQ